MNKALKEIQEKDISFDWAALSQLATDHVNPKQLIKDIYENGYEDAFKETYPDAYSDGVLDGKAEMLIKIAVIVTPLVVWGAYVGGNLWNRHKKSKEEIERLAKENAKLKAKKYVEKFENTISDEDTLDNVISIDFKSEIINKKSAN